MKGGGGRRHGATARHSRYHTEDGAHRAATSLYQWAPSERVVPVRGTSSYTHTPGRPPGPLVAAHEVGGSNFLLIRKQACAKQSDN